ncbi:hypothetical protein, partial [Kosakonia sacchari]|uniref:hypothetical protein n=1 Tax=Kosakonia sacchari TaxID=1158459 RepID=UPI000BE731CE
MKTEIITALMKTVAGTRPAADRALIENAVAVTTEKAAQKNAAAVSEALTRFTEAKSRPKKTKTPVKSKNYKLGGGRG